MSEPSIVSRPELGEGGSAAAQFRRFASEFYRAYASERENEACVELDMSNPVTTDLLGCLYRIGYLRAGPYELPVVPRYFSYTNSTELLPVAGINSLTMPAKPNYLAIVATDVEALSLGFLAGYRSYLEKASWLLYEQRAMVSSGKQGFTLESSISCWRTFRDGNYAELCVFVTGATRLSDKVSVGLCDIARTALKLAS